MRRYGYDVPRPLVNPEEDWPAWFGVLRIGAGLVLVLFVLLAVFVPLLRLGIVQQ